MRAVTALLFLLSLAGPVGAQTFVPGYVVVAGDTLRGEVALEGEAQNAAAVRFRPGPAAAETRYGPTQAEAYGADGGRQYRRGRFQLEAVPDPVAPELTERSAFARVVRDGAADLLAVEVVDERPVFFVRTDGEPVGLYSIAPRVGRRGGQFTYRPALVRALGDACGGRPPDVARAAYTERDLAAVVDAYNACVDPAYAPPASDAASGPVRRRARLGADVALAFGSGSFRREATPGPAPDDPGAAAPRLSAVGVLSLPYLGGRVSLVGGAEYERGVVGIQTSTVESGRAHVDLLHGRLGLRAAPTAGPLRLSAEFGVLLGPTLRRDGADEGNVAPGVAGGSVRASQGGYVEVGVGPTAFPVVALIRAQLTEFKQTLLVAGGDTTPYGTRTVSVGVAARF